MTVLFRSWRAAGAAALTLILLPSIAMDGQRAASPPGPYVVTDLGTFGAVQSAHANDINDAGQVVGLARNHAFLWQNGVMTDLGTLGGNSSAASAINAIGQVVGGATTAAPSTSHAVRWDNGVITNLTPGQASSASGINDAGQVIGTLTANWRGFSGTTACSPTWDISATGAPLRWPSTMPGKWSARRRPFRSGRCRTRFSGRTA